MKSRRKTAASRQQLPREAPAKIHVEPTGAHDLDATLLRKAIEATRLTPPQFARFLTRETQQITRWLASQYALPAAVRRRVLEILATHPEDRFDEVQGFLARVQRLNRRMPRQKNAHIPTQE